MDSSLQLPGKVINLQHWLFYPDLQEANVGPSFTQTTGKVTCSLDSSIQFYQSCEQMSVFNNSTWIFLPVCHPSLTPLGSFSSPVNRCQPLMTSLWVLPVLWVDVSLHWFHLHLFQFDQYQSCNEISAFNDSSFYQSSSRVQWLQFATSSNLQSVLWEADHSDRRFYPVLRVPEIVSLMPEFCVNIYSVYQVCLEHWRILRVSEVH